MSLPLNNSISLKDDWSHFEPINNLSQVQIGLVDPMNDWSPTIVNNGLFDTISFQCDGKDNTVTSDGESSNKTINCINDPLIKSNQISTRINNLFDKLYAKFYLPAHDNVFWEQWQYFIVTCNVTNEYNHYKHTVLKMKKSLVNLNKVNLKLNSINYRTHRIILKQIIIFLKHFKSNIHIDKDRNLRNFLLIWKSILDQRMQKKQLQQQHLLFELNNTINSINILDSLFQRFYLNFKELNNYKLISHKTDFNIETVVLQIEHFMKCLYDIWFFKIKNQLDKLIIYVDSEVLKKYCKLYGIDMIDLRYYINQNCLQLIDKSQRLKILQKFWLCVLLSLRGQSFGNDNCFTSNSVDKIEINEFISILKIKSNVNDTDSPHTETSNSLKDVLIQMRKFNHSLIDLMNEHKFFLNFDNKFDFFDTEIKNEIEKNNQFVDQGNNNTDNEEFLNFINVLDHLQLKLKNDEIKSEHFITHKDIIVSKLNEMLQYLSRQEDISSLETYIDSMHCMDTRITSTTSIKNHHGFSLDILKYDSLNHTTVNNKNHAPNNNFHNTKSKLDKPIEVIITNDNFDPDDIDSDTLDTTHRSTKNISDQELNQQLNDKIRQFASQNKLSKSQLRTQKSFQLLKKLPHMHLKSQESTEALIPVIYELNELVNL